VTSPDPTPARADEAAVSVVIVAYGPELWLRRSVEAVLASNGVTTEVVLVDNGGTEGMVDELGALDGVTVIDPGANIGFAAGCNRGVAAARFALVALVNPDAIVQPDALTQLATVARRPEVGIATASVRLADQPDLLNSAGNDVHFLGVSWSGGFEEPASDHAVETPVTAASGAALMMRRATWTAMGGLTEEFFAYYEDAELSLRCWQQGLEVRYVPSAVVVHRYEFSRNQLKYELLERNRLILVVTSFGPRHLLVMAPAFVALELAIVASAAAQGWLGAKLRGYAWLARHLGWLRRHRASIQGLRISTEAMMADRYTTRLQPGNLPPPRALLPLDRVLAAYWALARSLL
jgi:GT2 family glycosyltransferase